MSKQTETKALSKEEVAAKVLQLSIELHETKDRKKASTGAFNEEIKRIQKEIDELITEPAPADDFGDED